MNRRPVRDWEPRIALVAHGATEAVARAATEALRPGGWVVLEIAENQAVNVAGLLTDLGYEHLRISPVSSLISEMALVRYLS